MHASETQEWATFICGAHADALGLQQSFTVFERTTANLGAPRGNIISTVNDPSSVAQELPATIHTHVTPPLDAAAAAPKGVRFVAAGMRKLAEWRAFFCMHGEVPPLLSLNS